MGLNPIYSILISRIGIWARPGSLCCNGIKWVPHWLQYGINWVLHGWVGDWESHIQSTGIKTSSVPSTHFVHISYFQSIKLCQSGVCPFRRCRAEMGYPAGCDMDWSGCYWVAGITICPWQVPRWSSQTARGSLLCICSRSRPWCHLGQWLWEQERKTKFKFSTALQKSTAFLEYKQLTAHLLFKYCCLHYFIHKNPTCNIF